MNFLNPFVGVVTKNHLEAKRWHRFLKVISGIIMIFVVFFIGAAAIDGNIMPKNSHNTDRIYVLDNIVDGKPPYNNRLDLGCYYSGKYEYLSYDADEKINEYVKNLNTNLVFNIGQGKSKLWQDSLLEMIKKYLSNGSYVLEWHQGDKVAIVRGKGIDALLLDKFCIYGGEYFEDKYNLIRSYTKNGCTLIDSSVIPISFANNEKVINETIALMEDKNNALRGKYSYDRESKNSYDISLIGFDPKIGYSECRISNIVEYKRNIYSYIENIGATVLWILGIYYVCLAVYYKGIMYIIYGNK